MKDDVGSGYVIAFVLTELTVCLLSQRKRPLLAIDARLELWLFYDIAEDDRDVPTIRRTAISYRRAWTRNEDCAVYAA